MLFYSSLRLFHIASKFIPLKLQSIHILFCSTSKNQIFLTIANQLTQTPQRNFIIKAIRKVSNRHSPITEDALRVCSMLLIPIFLLEVV